MARVEVVNRQKIDGKEYKRGQVIDVSPGRARDLIAEGKVRAAEEHVRPVEKLAVKPVDKGATNG